MITAKLDGIDVNCANKGESFDRKIVMNDGDGRKAP